MSSPSMVQYVRVTGAAKLIARHTLRKVQVGLVACSGASMAVLLMDPQRMKNGLTRPSTFLIVQKVQVGC